MRKFIDTMLFVTVNVACFLFMYSVNGGDLSDSNSKYNLVFLAGMVILYGVGLTAGFYTIGRLNLYFQMAIGVLKGYKIDDGVNIITKISKLKGYKPIELRLNAFLTDLRNSQSGICDIQDYINDDETDAIVKKWLLDIIPDVFTSLGILGTFVGLVWGLKFFNTNDFESMTSSVSSLINGIKVAFLTSVFGMANSLAFTYSNSKGYSSLQANLQKFLDLFHANVVPSAEIESQNIMVHNQKGQYEALKSMSGEISDKLSGGADGNSKELKRINSNVEDLTSVMERSQQHLMEEMGSAFQSMRQSNEATENAISTISEISQRAIDASEEQGELLRKLLETQQQILEKMQ